MAQIKVNQYSIPDDAITLAKMASGTDGNIITYDASGNPAVVASGTSGHFLKSQGADTVPVFAAAGGGKIGQVVTTSSDSTFNTNSSTPVDLYTVDITPSASSSTILLTVSINWSSLTHNLYGFGRFVRDSTAIGIGSNGTNRQVCSSSYQNADADSEYKMNTSTMTYIDSPSSTSAITYRFQIWINSGGATFTVNYTGIDIDVNYIGRAISTMTAMEILA
jgi:hypothetical protein